MARWFAALVVASISASVSSGEVVVRPTEYRHGDVVLEGILAWDTVNAGKRGGVLIAHEVVGNGAVARSRATQYAKLGYVAFALDLFGKGVTPRDTADATARLGLAGRDRTLIRGRTEAALALLVKQPQADPKRIAAVGYGLGGTALLELARSGADLEGVVVLHGDLTTPNPADGKKVSAAVLAIVGGDDPKITPANVAAFEEEMRGGGVDWQVLRLGGVGHDFTNPQAGRNLKTGSAYDADADARGHAHVRAFLAESLAAPQATVAKSPTPKAAPLPAKGIPEKVLKILAYVDEHGEAMPNYEGGRTFGNFERRLVLNDSQGRRIRYREWDVNPLRPGVNRGAERLVTGSDGSAYFTDDHYNSFKKIR
ncbi:MAG: dienelactone hydrolase family protein [Gemmataceae bacterium]